MRLSFIGPDADLLNGIRPGKCPQRLQRRLAVGGMLRARHCTEGHEMAASRSSNSKTMTSNGFRAKLFRAGSTGANSPLPHDFLSILHAPSCIITGSRHPALLATGGRASTNKSA